MASKPQKNYSAGTAKDDLMTPGYALEPLLEFVPRTARIWEPAVGGGFLANALEHFGYQAVRSGFPASNQRNDEDFLAGYQPSEPWDIQITNPPFEPKIEWMARLLEIGKPWAVLVQDDTPALGSSQRMVRYLSPKIGLLWFSPRVAFRTPNKTFIPGQGWTWIEDDPKKKTFGKPVRSSAQFGCVWVTWGLGFTGNEERPLDHWTGTYRKGWENWHEGWNAAPPPLPPGLPRA